jgi:enoyl-CoA hydratase/carnithine racemase
MGHRKALHYVMTGDTWTGKGTAEMGLVNKSVPRPGPEAVPRRQDHQAGPAGSE